MKTDPRTVDLHSSGAGRFSLWAGVALVGVVLILVLRVRSHPGLSGASSFGSAREGADSGREETGSTLRSRASERREPVSKPADEDMLPILDSSEQELVDDLRKPLDARELSELAANPSKNGWRLRSLILRAAGSKNKEVRDTLRGRALRDDGSYDAELAAYDYTVDGDVSALDRMLQILGDRRTEAYGERISVVCALGFVDEWDRSMAAVNDYVSRYSTMRSQGISTGGETDAVFIARRCWLVRQELHPEGWRKYLAEYRAAHASDE